MQDEGAADGDAAAPIKKKKKKTKGAIASNPAVFNGDFDTNDCIGKVPASPDTPILRYYTAKLSVLGKQG